MNQDPRFAINRAGALSSLAVAYLFLLSIPASADDRLDKLLPCPGPVPDCIGKWCPDEYCAKNSPCISVPLCFGCDDYCSKKQPCVDAPLCFRCDDYGRKCLPKVCSALQCPDLKCGPSRQCRGLAKCGQPCDGFAAHTVDVPSQHRAFANQQPVVDQQRPAALQGLPALIEQSPDFKLTK